jgi:hypothetical protein
MSPAPVIVRLQDLGDSGQPFCDGIVTAGLPDLQRDERGDLIAERGRIHVGSVSGDDAPVAHPI